MYIHISVRSVLTLFNLLSPEGAAPPSPSPLSEHTVSALCQRCLYVCEVLVYIRPAAVMYSTYI